MTARPPVQGQQCPLQQRCQQRHQVQCSCPLDWRHGQSRGRWVLCLCLKRDREVLLSAWHMVNSRAHQHKVAFNRFADKVYLFTSGLLIQVSARQAQMLGMGSAELQAPRPEASLPVEVQASGHTAGAEAQAPRQAGSEVLAPRLGASLPADIAMNARPPAAGARPDSSGTGPHAASSDAAVLQARPMSRGEQW